MVLVFSRRIMLQWHMTKISQKNHDVDTRRTPEKYQEVLDARPVNCLNTYLSHKVDTILTHGILLYTNTSCLSDIHFTFLNFCYALHTCYRYALINTSRHLQLLTWDKRNICHSYTQRTTINKTPINIDSWYRF